MNLEEAKEILKYYKSAFNVLFGIFGGCYFPRPHYLNFLHLDDWKESLTVKDSLLKIDRIINRNSRRKITKAISTLLVSMDWRCHLVACVTIMKMDEEFQQNSIPMLWNKLATDGSWGSLQLLAMLSIIDDEFIDNLVSNLSNEMIIPPNYNPNQINEFIEQLNTLNHEVVYVEWRIRLKELLNLE